MARPTGGRWMLRSLEMNVNTSEVSFSSSTLDKAVLGETLVVLKVDPPSLSPEWKKRLEEIGFVVGEQVRLMAKAIPGGDPMVVRVGQSTFALRRVEAACISVMPTDALASSTIDQWVVEGGQA